MLTKQTDIAAIITARICHDLISPIGAISNGLELLALTGTPLSPELALITESANAANAKLRFLRIAFGSATSESIISHTEITDILDGYYNEPHTRLNWTIKTPLKRRDLGLLFLLLLCAEKLSPYSTAIEVTDTGADFSMILCGENLKTDQFLDTETHKFQPQNEPSLIQFNLVPIHLAKMGYGLTITQTTDRLCFRIVR